MRNVHRSEWGISETVSVILILSMVIILAVIAGASFFSIVMPVEKSGYLVPKAELVNLSDATVISLQHNAGDIFALNATQSGTGYHVLGMIVSSGGTSYPVGLAPSLGQERFMPGSRLFIYTSGSSYLATDNATSIPATGSVPGGSLVLALTDETTHVLLDRIVLGSGNASTTTTATPTPTVTPLAAGTVYLNAGKGGALQSGGSYQFTVTGPWSTVTLGSTTYNLNTGDTVRLVTGSDGYGNLYATSTTINTFAFDDVTLVINGVQKGKGTITSIWISGYSSQSSTLTLAVPAVSAWTNFRVDGSTLILGTDTRPIMVTGLKAPMNMAASAGAIYYDGAASGYSFI